MSDITRQHFDRDRSFAPKATITPFGRPGKP
jgi:hypothetical protein